MIVIVDYDAGNLASIQNMLRRLGSDGTISSDPAVVGAAAKLILPGVGHFDHGMTRLRQSGLVDVLNQRVMRENTPILGICLGAQLMAEASEEGSSAGLGWFAMRVRRFDETRMGDPRLKIPHMGWNDVHARGDHPLFRGLRDEARFYFVHSYHFELRDPGEVLATATHGYEFPAAFGRDKIAGVQFHPEKSHQFGKQLLANFVGW
jgi:glutamine amidotransferase